MKICVISKDLDCGYDYSVHLTEHQAISVVLAKVGDTISLGSEGSHISIQHKTITVRQGDCGGTSCLEKSDVISKINSELLKT